MTRKRSLVRAQYGPFISSGDTVLVGHIRVTDTTISLVACGDQLRTGAALNAVRIAESLAMTNKVIE